MTCPEPRSRPRRSSSAASATARRTASSTSTRASGDGSGRSRRARASRSPASAAAWSRSSASTSILHEGRSDLLTVTGVSTVDGYPRLRSSGPAIGAGARACDAVLRLLDSAEANPPAYNLLCRYLSLLDDPAEGERAAGLETALAFRLKLALVAGFVPELAACARCGESEHLVGFSGAAGGVVCAGCEGDAFAARRGSARLHGRGPGTAAERGAGGRAARPAPGRTGGGGDARAPRARAASRRGLSARKLPGQGRGRGRSRLRPATCPSPPPSRTGSAPRRTSSSPSRRPAPTRRGASSPRPTARCGRRFSATATASSTPSRSAG